MTQRDEHGRFVKEPKELGPEAVDIAGKEPVLARDWDEITIRNALAFRQPDIIEKELAYLTEPGTARAETWAKRSRRRLVRYFDDVPADIAGETLAKCQLDGIPVKIEESEEAWPVLEGQIETRFHDAVEHVEHPLQGQALYYKGLPR